MSWYKKAWVKDDSTKTITIICKDNDDTLEGLINVIKDYGNVGHTLGIKIDSGDKERSFDWDGDGSDAIYEISVKKG